MLKQLRLYVAKKNGGHVFTLSFTNFLKIFHKSVVFITSMQRANRLAATDGRNCDVTLKVGVAEFHAQRAIITLKNQ